jgi:hypothetical protein
MIYWIMSITLFLINLAGRKVNLVSIGPKKISSQLGLFLNKGLDLIAQATTAYSH